MKGAVMKSDDINLFKVLIGLIYAVLIALIVIAIMI